MLGQRSCYRTNLAQVSASGDKLIIGIELSESLFIHTVSHREDYISGIDPWREAETSKLHKKFQKYEIYIGDSANYSENAKVPGGPFLDPDNLDTYVLSSYA